jgi:hypothetical protein
MSHSSGLLGFIEIETVDYKRGQRKVQVRGEIAEVKTVSPGLFTSAI